MREQEKLIEKVGKVELVSAHSYPNYSKVQEALDAEFAEIDKGNLPGNIYFWGDYRAEKYSMLNNYKRPDVEVIQIDANCKIYEDPDTGDTKPMTEEIFDLLFLNNHEKEDKKIVIFIDNLELAPAGNLKYMEKFLDKEKRKNSKMSKKWVICAMGEAPYNWCDEKKSEDVFSVTKYFKHFVVDKDKDPEDIITDIDRANATAFLRELFNPNMQSQLVPLINQLKEKLS